jgi:hypothetical protein
MRRMLVLLGLVAAAGFGVSRMVRSSPGTLRQGAQRTAELVRRRGPDVTEQAARGIEQLGEVAEKGAERIRERSEGGEEPPAPEETESYGP